MAKEHAIVLASLERRTRDAEAVAQAALAHQDSQRQEQEEQEQDEEQHQTSAHNSPVGNSSLNASGRRVSFAAPTSPLPSMLRRAVKLAEGVGQCALAPCIPSEQQAVDDEAAGLDEFSSDVAYGSGDTSPTPSPLPRSAYTPARTVGDECDGTQNCVDLAAEIAGTPVHRINLADEETTVDNSVDTVEMPMAVYDEDTAVNPADMMEVAETATARGVEMVSGEKQTALAEDQEEEEHSVQAVDDVTDHESEVDQKFASESAAADPVSASATSARLADRQAERRHSMAAFEQRVEAAKAYSSPTSLQNSQQAAAEEKEALQQSCGRGGAGVDEYGNDDCGDANDEGDDNIEANDDCDVENDCLDGGNNNYKEDGNISGDDHDNVASYQEVATVANPSTSLRSAPQAPPVSGQSLPSPEVDEKAGIEADESSNTPSNTVESTPIAATAATLASPMSPAGNEDKKESQAGEATSSSSPLPPYEPWELSPSAAAAAEVPTATQPEPTKKPASPPSSPLPPPVPFRVSQIVWALDSRAPPDSPTAFWPAKVAALHFKPLAASASSGDEVSSSEVPSCHGSAPGSAVNSTARNLEASSDVAPGEWWLDVKFYTNYPAVAVAARNVKAWSDHQESARASAVGALSVLRQVTGSSSHHPLPHKAAAAAGKKNKREAARSVAIAAARQEIANLEEAKVFVKRQAEVKAVRQRQQQKEEQRKEGGRLLRKEASRDQSDQPPKQAKEKQAKDKHLQKHEHARLQSPPLPRQGTGSQHVGAGAAAGVGHSSRPTSPVERLQALNLELQGRLEKGHSLQIEGSPKQALVTTSIEIATKTNADESAMLPVRRSRRVQPQACEVCGCNASSVQTEVRKSSKYGSSSSGSQPCDSCRALASSSVLAHGPRGLDIAGPTELKPAKAQEIQPRAPLTAKKNRQAMENFSISRQSDEFVDKSYAVKSGKISSRSTGLEKENASATRVPSLRLRTTE